jgi:hypothetical protein
MPNLALTARTTGQSFGANLVGRSSNNLNFFSGSFYKVSNTFGMGNRSEQLNAQARAMVEETKELELTWWWELDVCCLSPPTRGIV